MRKAVVWMACCVVSLLAAQVRAEAIDNPAYASWARCKPGTTVVIKGDSAAHTMTITKKLVEVTPDQCVVAVHTEMTGAKHPLPDRQDKVQRQLTDPDDIDAYKKATQHPTEGSITVRAGTFKCMCYDKTSDDEPIAKSQVWVCADVPGLTVKSIYKASGKTTTSELQSLDKK